MRNKYPGICYRCKNLVEPGTGHFERTPFGWRVQHADCAILHRKPETAARKSCRYWPKHPTLVEGR